MAAQNARRAGLCMPSPAKHLKRSTTAIETAEIGLVAISCRAVLFIRRALGGLHVCSKLNQRPCSLVHTSHISRCISMRWARLPTNMQPQKMGAVCKVVQAQQASVPEQRQQSPARQAVERFYACYNAGDVEGMMGTMAKDCAYHDLALFNEPHVGHDEIRGFFQKVFDTVPGDLDFVLDAVSADERNCSVKWHTAIAGHEFPFSRGVSFYEVNEEGLIVAGRDLVESAIKPGGAALQALALLAPVVRKLGPKANPGQLKKVPQQAILMGVLFAGWFWLIYLSTVLPGNPAWNAEPWVVKETLDESLNFWFLNSFSQWLKLPYIPFDKWNPVHEAFFNFENAWSFLFLPTMMNDPRGRFRTPLWFGAMFLTNVFMLPYMALRLLPVSKEQEQSRPQLPLGPFKWPAYTPLYGVIGGFVGVVCVWWGLAYRPEYGGLADRAAYFVEALKTDRAFILITTDCLLYVCWHSAIPISSSLN
ncbi:hypothetical protein WJX84_010691 [Apatococcus fuscideae]|uniref:SnoaL-like domain-containing protein n=1 Tax=Apatococcus fuscideae TaxID=2026836 RepID=A0AAW1SUR7_9CHLO